MSKGDDQPALLDSLDEKLGVLRTTLPAVVTFIALLVVWEGVVRYEHIPAWMLPSPSAIFAAFLDWRSELLHDSLVTMYETVVGLGLAIVISMPLAVLITWSAFLRKTIYPILLALQSMPKVAIAPLIALWIGFGTAPKVIVVFLVCFFPIIVATTSGLASVRPTLLELARSLRATEWQIFMKLRFPSAMPSIFVGLKIAVTLAVIGAVIGEFVGAQDGLGYAITMATTQAKTPLAFASLLILTVMSIVLYYVIELIERLVVPWSVRH